MSIFSSILQKLGLQKPAAAAPVSTPAAAPVKPAAAPTAAAPVPPPAQPTAAAVPPPTQPTPAPVPPPAQPTPAAQPTAAAVPPPAQPNAALTPEPVKPAAISVVDVVSHLETLAKSHPGLNWKVSIADLLRLLDMDPSYEARKELATELGCPAELMSDSASMNIWLHKTVLQKIAENGGNIPTSLLS